MTEKRKVILVVDDSPTSLDAAVKSLEKKYNVLAATSGKMLFKILEGVIPDLILMDVDMPEMDGFEALSVLKNSLYTASIPVIFLTGHSNPKNELKGLSLGAIDYISKPFTSQLLLKRIEVHLLAELQRKQLQVYSSGLEELVNEKRRAIFELQNAILRTVAELVESRDSVTGGHIDRTQAHLRILVDAMLENSIYVEELSTWDMDLFIMSSQLHDVGKISIKDNILMKPDTLTGDEFNTMKWHATSGMNIIMKIEEATRENAFLKHARIMAGSHHEKWDGTGYFLGLKGEDIPLQGRLMSIVDVYDALTNDRPYKKAISHKEAIKVIEEGIGSHFDPKIGEVFVRYEADFERAALGGGVQYFSASGATGEISSSVISAVANIVDARSDETGSTTGRIQDYLRVFMEALLQHPRYKSIVSHWDIELFLLSAQLHDVGKFAVDDNLLNKATALTYDEFEKIKSHADFGAKVIDQISQKTDRKDLLRHAEIMAGSHHEKWDGSGYPLGLKGEAIPLQGRLMAIVDVYEALTCDRPHRKKVTHEEAVRVIVDQRGRQFDPGLVDIFVENAERFLEVSVLL